MTRTVLASMWLLSAFATTLPAQWTEVGDAGDLPSTAQIPTTPTSPLPSIIGTLSSASDVDMYLIYIPNPAAFSATTVGGATYDTQLFLFFPDGRGVASNDDSAATAQSTLTAAFVPYPGLYYLAVSGYDNDPLAMGQEIWNDTPFSAERRPDGPRRGESIDSWSGFGGSGAYTITLTGCERPRKQVVAPDNHYLTESTGVTLPSGSTSWWRGAGGRFQVLYEASHFTNVGMTSGWIDKVFFRGEDGEPNAGGQSWAGVTVQVGRTPMTAATLTNDFAANLAAAVSLSPVGAIPAVTVARSAGAFPNNYNIELNLYAAFGGYFYTPTTGNLLIDVTMPAAATLPPTSGPVMAMQDTSGTAAFVRGAGVNAGIGALTGTLSAFPPVIAIGIDGIGGAAPPIVATNVNYGAGCGGSPSSFYQTFRNGEAVDLSGLTLTPDNVPAPNYYNVSGGAGAFDPTKVNGAPNSTGDDATVLLTLGFTHAFPGGSTTAIRPCTNGYIWLDGTSTSADFTPSVGEFLGSVANPARLAPFWMDLQCGHNTATHPNSGLHALVDTSGGPGNWVAYATWFNVGAFNEVSGVGIGGHSVYNFQVAIFQATGVVEFRYGSMPSNAQTGGEFCMTGFTRGRIGTVASVDPQSRDLSVEVPFQTYPEGALGNMLQMVAATPQVGGANYGGRAFAGQTLTFNCSGVPPGAIIGVQLLDLVSSRPGIYIPGIVPPGCGLATGLSPTLFEVTLFPGATVTGAVPLAVPPGVEGAELFAQYVLLDGLFGGPSLTTALSNALRVRVGRN